MKVFLSSLAIGLVIFGNFAYCQEERDNSGRPCYEVNVQINRNNRTNVRQKCAYNDSRTMQAGQNNDASTSQKGEENTNEVRQYEFNAVERRR